MSQFGSQTFRGRATLEPANTLVIYNTVSPGTANTEFSQVLSDGTKEFIIRNRGTEELKFTTVSGESGTTYFTLMGNAVWSKANVNLNSTTLFMQTPGISQIIEIMEWS